MRLNQFYLLIIMSYFMCSSVNAGSGSLPVFTSNKFIFKKISAPAVAHQTGTYANTQWSAIRIPADDKLFKRDTVDGQETLDEDILTYLKRKNTFKVLAVTNGGFHDDHGVNACRVGMDTYWSGQLTDSPNRWCYGMNISGTVFEIEEMNIKLPNGNYTQPNRSTFENKYPFGITGIAAMFVNKVKKPYPGLNWPGYKNYRTIIAHSTNNDIYLIVCGMGWTWDESCDFLQKCLPLYETSFVVKDAVMHDGSTCSQLGYRIGKSEPVMLQYESRGCASKFRGYIK